MKRVAVLLGLTLMVAQAGTASAKTLEEVLKEKGVITEADYKEIIAATPKSKPMNYKLGSGFTFTSPDEKFQLTLGGQLQSLYTYKDKGGDGQTNNSEFKLRRAKTLFSGYAFSKDLTFKFNQNWAQLNTFNSGNTNSNTSQVMEETYLNYRISDPLQVRLGQDKVQFSRQYITSSSQNQFVDSSFVTSAFAPGYDTGLALNGRVADGLLTYAAQLMGGKGQNVAQGTNNNAYNFRIALNPLGDMKYSESDVDNSAKPLVSAGASYYHDTIRRNTDTTKAPTGFDNHNLNFAGKTGWLGSNAGQFGAKANVNVNMLEGDMAFKYSGFSLQGEYFWAEGTGDSATAGKSATVISKGFYTQAGYFVIPKTVEVAARYGWMDYNQDMTGSLKSEVQGAVSWYIAGHNLKIQADVTKSYAQNKVDNRVPGGSVNDTIFRTQAQLLF
ncbi:MAG: porin [Desulfuromonadaceae bacterium]|nr:porin [Desulfuromonadaceae bacterium]